MTEIKHGVDESFNDRLNILRAAVLGANRGGQCHTKHLDHFPIWLIGDSGRCLFDGRR